MKRHILEATKAALFLYVVRLAGFYSVSLYLENYPKEVVDASLSLQDEALVEEEDVIIQKQIVKKIVKVPVIKKIENEILQTELTPEEKLEVEKSVKNKFKVSSSNPSEMLRLISSIQASQRQITDVKKQMEKKVSLLTSSLDEIHNLQTAFQKEQSTVPTQKVNTNVKSLLPNIVKVLENESQEDDHTMVANTMSLANYELKQLSKLVKNGTLDTKAIYKLFDDISNIMETKKKMSHESESNETLKDEGNERAETEEEEDNGFARESDLTALYHDLENRFQSRLDSFFTEDSTTNAFTTVASSLAAAHVESMNVRQSDQKKIILQERIQKMEQIMDMMKQHKQKQLEREQQLEVKDKASAIGTSSENDSKLCVQQNDITYLVEAGINALLTRKSSLEQVLTNSLQDLLEEYIDDFEEIETYKVKAPTTTKEGALMEDEEIYRHESSSLLMDQENLRSLVDTAILPKIVSWMDIFIDNIAGYNDSLDTVIDFLAGDEKKGESFGKRFQSLLMKSFESIKLPIEIKELILDAGILTTQPTRSF